MAKKQMSLEKARSMSKKEKEKLARRIEQDAHDNEVIYWGCSQAVFDSLQRNFDLEDGKAFKAASAFAGGVAGMREVCGALLGGVMAIGLAYGRANFEPGKITREQPAFLEASIRSRILCERFRETFGTLRCCDLKVSIRGDDYKEYPRFDTLESFEDHAKCGDVTGPAARLAAQILLEPTELFMDEMNDLALDIVKVRKLQKAQHDRR